MPKIIDSFPARTRGVTTATSTQILTQMSPNAARIFYYSHLVPAATSRAMARVSAVSVTQLTDNGNVHYSTGRHTT